MPEPPKEIPIEKKMPDPNLLMDSEMVDNPTIEPDTIPICSSDPHVRNGGGKVDTGAPDNTLIREPVRAENTIQYDSKAPALSERQKEALKRSAFLWKVKPIPAGPDGRKESHAMSMILPHKLNLIGAYVRGKGHKHDGVNCDDWFEFDTVQDWTIMAVADGVGAAALSRVGSQEACITAVNSLKEKLSHITLTEKKSIEEFRNRDTDGNFPDRDMDKVEKSLHLAVEAAYHSLEEARDARKDVKEYTDLLGRNPNIKDFSTTLLLAVHSCTVLDSQVYDFIMSIQVGDGMIAAINMENKLELLGKADRGENAGETVAITSSIIRDPKEKSARTSFSLTHLKALLLVTDGVADDYHPNDPEMLGLYNDLVRNEIILPPVNGVQAGGQDTEQPVSAEKKLEKWLDTYDAWQSFDDRTLAALYRGDQN